MAYMQVLSKTDNQLHLLREPSFLSKAVFCGFMVGVTGIILFGSESLPFKALIGFSALILSSFMVDNYEIFNLDKQLSQVHLSKLHICQYLLRTFLAPCPYVTSNLSDIEDVRVESSGPQDSKKSHRVILVLKSGIRLGVTEVFTTNEFSEHEQVAKLIKSYIISSNDTPKSEDDINQGLEDVCDSSSLSEDDDKNLDDFEEITKDDIAKLEVEEEQAKVTECGDVVPESTDKPKVQTQETCGSGEQVS